MYLLGPEEPFQYTISSEYSSFSVQVRSSHGLFLDKSPFSNYESSLTSPTSYMATQALGACMRESGVEIFQYISARDKNRGKNAGLFTPKAFQSTQPSELTTWLCQTSIMEVGFLSKEEKHRILYQQQEFWVEDLFPSPAI